jgi:hypothetical protein
MKHYKIKPLEWEKFQPGDIPMFNSSNEMYRVYQGDTFGCMVFDAPYSRFRDFDNKHTIEEAKAACQKHWEEYLLKYLELVEV